ncbi:MAG: DNA cytosine methyltransferase [Pseudonocardiaceae bacterium]
MAVAGPAGAIMPAVAIPGEHPSTFSVAGMFAGIGGLERGLHAAGGRAELLCECWPPACSVLRARFPGVDLAEDVRSLERLPEVDVVTAGFPCTDLSQAGRTVGIHGRESSLVNHLFRLLEGSSPRWVVVENVRNMLFLDAGAAMDHLVDRLEALGYRWAYRLVDSRFTGVPQRRQRVILVASKLEDPSRVLFADDAGEPGPGWFRDDVHGFYWTEGLRGLGWAQDAVPTLKGGSTIGIPSAPAVWIRDRAPGAAIGTPGIGDAEQMQGFPVDWTEPAEQVARPSIRWKLVGNAVTVGVAEWLGRRLAHPGEPRVAGRVALVGDHRWPVAARGERGRRWAVDVSMWPERRPYRHLLDLLDEEAFQPLSKRAIDGFLGRVERSSLRFDERFRLAVKEHAALASPRERS